MHPGDLARGCSDLEMIWLLCCAGAATGSECLQMAKISITFGDEEHTTEI